MMLLAECTAVPLLCLWLPREKLRIVPGDLSAERQIQYMFNVSVTGHITAVSPARLSLQVGPRWVRCLRPLQTR
jgi:hypothetical protein